jgi:primosomal protein N' (replication factor Y)
MAPEDSPIAVGDLVQVPLRQRQTYGLVMDFTETSTTTCKAISNTYKISLGSELVEFIRGVANYNLLPPGLVFALTFTEKFLPSPKKVKVYSLQLPVKGKISSRQKPLVDFLEKNFPQSYPLAPLQNLCSREILRTLVQHGTIREEWQEMEEDVDTYKLDPEYLHLHSLSPEQQAALTSLLNHMATDTKPILLDGITGSGKTEIYFHLFAKILSDTGQILFLLPEIALTNQFVERFREQFGAHRIAVWHSGISNATKRTIWNALRRGTINFVMGARSALFLPFKNLRLVVLDEEHDDSYKQTDNICYHARPMAVLRSRIHNCHLLLGSATPSLESLVQVEEKKYHYVPLANRFGVSTTPHIDIIDLTKTKLKPNSFLTEPLREEIQKELEDHRQILLYLNRRGYAPLIICHNCGFRFECPNCATPLTVHETTDNFICHYCGHTAPRQNDCPSCGLKNSLLFFGPGVEKIEKEVKKTFPTARTCIITSDTITSITEAEKFIHQIISNEVDIIIGTQMITKGYDFPNLTLVGILDADASLLGTNYRATEKTHQLLTQVIGRAGRRNYTGRALIQTHSPQNFIIRALVSGNREILMNFEKENRKNGHLPPYGRILLLSLSGTNKALVLQKMNEIVNVFPVNNQHLEIFGPTPHNPFCLNNNFRFKLLIHTTLQVNIQKLISHLLNIIKLPSQLKLKIDMDPLTT